MPAARSKEPWADTPTVVASTDTVTRAWRGIGAHSVLRWWPPVKPRCGERPVAALASVRPSVYAPASDGRCSSELEGSLEGDFRDRRVCAAAQLAGDTPPAAAD